MASGSSAPTAAPWVHFTSSVRISSRGRVSISAWSESSRFLLVWLASVPGAAWEDDDASVEHSVAAVGGDAFVELAAGAARGGVLDQDRVVVVAVASGQVQAVDGGVGAFAFEADPYFVAGDPRAERHRKRREPAVGALADVEQPEMESGVGFVLDLVVLDCRFRGRRPPGSRRWCTWRRQRSRRRFRRRPAGCPDRPGSSTAGWT